MKNMITTIDKLTTFDKHDIKMIRRSMRDIRKTLHIIETSIFLYQRYVSK